MNHKLYPLRFVPILKEKIWGGKKLAQILHKSSVSENVGESWEISDVEGDTSEIHNGSFKGRLLSEILDEFKGELLGEKVYKEFGSKFPLLIKFIDAREDLSIQLHPNDSLAAERHNSFGKTEMWYVMQADENAKLIVGFKDKVEKGLYLKSLEEKKLPEILNFEEVEKGDTYFIEVGRVHAIGAGVLLAEIQQTSDITYRLYDWDRKDNEGNERDLHTDLAIEAIDFNMKDNFKVNYAKTKNQVNSMVSCPYFKTQFLTITKPLSVNNDFDSFLIYICVEGEVLLNNNSFSEEMKTGETLLVPASIKSFKISSSYGKLLQVYV